VVGQLLSRAYPERKIEVFNAGRDWATTRHSLIAYSTYYQDWKPDLVLILEGINDLYRSFSPPAYALGEYDALYSHFYGASAQGAKPPTFEQYLFEWWRGPIAGEFWYEAPFVKRREVNYPLDRYYSLPSFEANLVKLVHAVRSTGAQPVLITQASLLKPVMTDEERKALWFGEAFCTTRVGFARYESPSPASLGEGLAGFNAAMRRVAQNEAVQLVNADSEIQKSLAMFEDDCHYTAAGAQRLAEVVANAIKSGALIQ
jgi:lysophospholipase L1-like esterase